ncbi:uncharacterized protein LOC124899562 [Capsicum annuum]|uniref:uncharacterized protein LOC124899562 n=1 Tax=Capsicum annuum TaxID=4072 RepID=UPI001FB13A36|nr:uncharacterized protein LOC124899562 [Capsicum annuum]
MFPESWECKCEAISEAHNMDTLTMDDLIENLKMYELKKNQEREIIRVTKKNNLVLKATKKVDFEPENLAVMTMRSQKMLRRSLNSQNRNQVLINYEKKNHVQVCHKCDSPKHFIKFCPLWTVDHKKNNQEKSKEKKKYLVLLSHKIMTKCEADVAVKRVLDKMGKSSNEFEDEEPQNQSLLAMMEFDDKDPLALVAIADSNGEQ